jgi:hypothetical protein
MRIPTRPDVEDSDGGIPGPTRPTQQPSAKIGNGQVRVQLGEIELLLVVAGRTKRQDRELGGVEVGNGV